MELAICTEFVEGKLAFKNAQLKTATQKIMQGMKSARKGFLTAGLELKRIQDEKLYEKDFFDKDGKPSFAMYVEEILGISKTTAYRIIKTTQQLLVPEMLDEKRPAFFENFSDGALDALTTLKDYDTALEFCEGYGITETTSRDIIREYIKAYKDGYKTVEDYANKENEVETELDEAETDSGENEQIKMTYENKECEEMRGYLEFVADLFKSDIKTAFDLCSDEDEEKVVKEIVKKYATI